MRAGKLADETARRLHGLLNEEREKQGLRPLSGRGRLIKAAEGHSRNMARKETLAHHLDGSGPSDRAPSRFSRIAENCAYTHGRDPGKTAHKLRDQWMNSKDHRDNLLNSKMKYDGIGVWVNGNTVYATHLLAGSSAFDPFDGLFSSKSSSRPSSRSDIDLPSLPSYLSIRQRQLLYGTVFGTLVYQLARMQLPAAISRFDFGPIPLLCIGGMVCAESISDTNRIRYLLTNSGVVSLGYVAMEVLHRSPIDQRELILPPPEFVFWALAAGSLGGGLLWAARRTPY